MEPGEQGYFAVATASGNYDGLTLADAGGMIVVQQAGQGWILRMPDGATGSKTLTWTASCGRVATMGVAAQVSGACTDSLKYCDTTHYFGAAIGSVVCVAGVWRRITSKAIGSRLCGDYTPFWCLVDTGSIVDCQEDWKNGPMYAVEVI